MSSPLGGFYIAAHNRKKAAQDTEKNKVRFSADITLMFDEVEVLVQSPLLCADEPCRLDSKHASIAITPAVLSSGLISLKCDVMAKGKYANKGTIGEQQLNIEPGEAVSTLVAGNCGVKLTVVLSR